MKLEQPWPPSYSINKNSPFGWRRDPITGARKFHHGIDVALPQGTPLTAPADGVVVHKGSGASGGNTLIIKHASNLFTVYYHLARPSDLPKGARVKTHDVIAYSGNTGRSTGPHLHMEVRKSQRWGDTVDPVPYLQGSPAVTGPSVVKVTGKLDRATWRAFQEALKASGHDPGVIDGRPGPRTYRAVQAWAGVKVDGVIGPQTRKAVQRKLGVKDDGIWGRLTVSALQRAINGGEI